MKKIQTEQKIEARWYSYGAKGGAWYLIFLSARGTFDGWVKKINEIGEPYPATFSSEEEAEAYRDEQYEYHAPKPLPPRRPLTAQEREEYRRLREEERQERERMAEEAEAEMQQMEQDIISARHPAFVGYATYLESHPSTLRNLREEMDQGVEYLPVSNEECLFFCLEQICKVGKQYPEGATRQEIRCMYADVKTRGGDAWAEHKARMQQLTK